MLRLDYSGCGASEGPLEDGTLDRWRDGVLKLMDTLVEGPVLLVGSSMSGWLMLLVACARPERVKALVGIAAAPDFTSGGFTADQKALIRAKGRIEETSEYDKAAYHTPLSYVERGARKRDQTVHTVRREE